MHGRIHSIESFGTVDGPGIRFVIFFQGCPMRCLYCHNPDTWADDKGMLMTAKDLIKEYDKNKAFYKNGGITVTGGEPLWQMDFLIELFTLAKKEGISTCLDTSGILFQTKCDSFEQLIKVTDLVLLDIKHINEEKHIKLTNHSNKNVLNFSKFLSAKQVPVWIRYVVVKGITDDDEDLKQLGWFLGGLKNIKALDLLPYHTIGEEKYNKMHMAYPLKGVVATSKAEAIKARNTIFYGIKMRLSENTE